MKRTNNDACICRAWSPVHTAYGAVRRHILHARPWTHSDVRRHKSPTSTQDTADAKNICCTYRNLLRNATERNIPHKSSRARFVRHVASVDVRYGDAVCVNAAVEINVLDYNVAVRWCTYVDVRRRSAPHVVWMDVNTNSPLVTQNYVTTMWTCCLLWRQVAHYAVISYIKS